MSSEVDQPLSTLTGARQTMLAWARVVESAAAIPEAYRSSYHQIVGAQQPFPYTVFAPAIAGWRQMTTEKLLCDLNDSLYIWERRGRRVTLTAYPVPMVSDFECGSILLFSWITISGVTAAGDVASTMVEYNTATSRHLAPLVSKLRPAPAQLAPTEQGLERAKLEYLAANDFKFMNFARESLTGGERVLQTLWRPPIHRPRFPFGGRVFSRTLSLAQLIILTDHELIVIRDDERSEASRGVRYGGRWHYIALRNISAVSLQDWAEDLVGLVLTLTPGGRKIEFLAEASQKEDLGQLQATLEKRSGLAV